MTDSDGLRERAERAAAGGIATTIHAIGDAAMPHSACWNRSRRPRR